jgi:hypothetical protein
MIEHYLSVSLRPQNLFYVNKIDLPNYRASFTSTLNNGQNHARVFITGHFVSPKYVLNYSRPSRFYKHARSVTI